jgi:anti-sigma factor RsiW
MSDCRRIVESLTPYLDGTLPPAERADVERHLGECPPCCRAAAEAEGGRTVLRRCSGSLRQEPLPPGLRTRCEALAREQGGRRTRAGWSGRFVPTVAIAALLVVTASTLFSLATQRSAVLLAQQLTVDHAKCFKLFASPDADGVDAHQMEAMLADRYGWTVHVPPTSPEHGVKLVGARRCLYAGGTMPHVMYQVNGEEMSLFLLDGAPRDDADVSTLGHRSRIWSRGAMTYVLVSPDGGVDLDRAARYVREQSP